MICQPNNQSGGSLLKNTLLTGSLFPFMSQGLAARYTASKQLLVEEVEEML